MLHWTQNLSSRIYLFNDGGRYVQVRLSPLEREQFTLTLVMPNKLRYNAHFSFSADLLDTICWYKFKYWMTNSADPAQKPTDLELYCLQRQGISGFSRLMVTIPRNYTFKKMGLFLGPFRVDFVVVVVVIVVVCFVFTTVDSGYLEVRGTLKYFEISVLWYIRFAELRKN